MDFEDAALRLARDQSKMRGRRAGRGIAISAKARKQAEYQKKRQAALRAEKERHKANASYQLKCLHDSQRSWNEKSLSQSQQQPLALTPTSIHGNGDKIALPPSVLHRLTSQEFSPNDAGNPWIFRIGIPNPRYEFPASPLFQVLQAPITDDDDDDDEMSDNDDDDDDETPHTARYLDELAHKYLAYTHCTVVEFTQEEGHVGIPRHIAEALLDPKNRHASNTDTIPITRTVDPAASSANDKTDTNDESMEPTEQTPGHLAWGRFDIPDVALEITAVQLPKGTGCTLLPTQEAIRNNFYGLKDVKLVLEQSLVRTRATLSKGDTVSTWHRGKKYDLKVSKVLPSRFRAITCINTDIEVELGEESSSATNTSSNPTNTESSSSSSPPLPTPSNSSSGFRLGGSGGIRSPPRADGPTPAAVALRPEPPADQTAGVCTVQIQHSGGRGKRRFAIDTATAHDLFAFAQSLTRHGRAVRLVTRFPRREYVLANHDDDSSDTLQRLRAESTLVDAGLRQGQELFLVEEL